MNIYGNPLFWVGLIIAAAILYFYYRYFIRPAKRKIKTSDKPETIIADTKKKGENRTDAVIGDGNINVRLADNKTAKIYNTTISEKTALAIFNEYKTLGREWNREGKKLFGLNRFLANDGTWQLKPIIPPNQITNSPNKLFNDIQQPAIGLVVSEMLRDEDKPFLEKYGVVLWWIAVMGFLMFLWANS